MTTSAEPSTPSGLLRNSTTKATDHELQKYDNFTRYEHRVLAFVMPVRILNPFRILDGLARAWNLFGSDFIRTETLRALIDAFSSSEPLPNSLESALG
jgi:hypothetical protein